MAVLSGALKPRELAEALAWARSNSAALARLHNRKIFAKVALDEWRRGVIFASGEKPVPKSIGLAMLGWESLHHRRKAA